MAGTLPEGDISSGQISVVLQDAFYLDAFIPVGRPA